MENSADKMKKMDDMVKELGMEEEMDRLVDSFTDNFMVSGEVTEDLQETLRRSPDALLDMIWDCIVRKEPAEEVERDRKEEELYQAIQDDLKENIIYLEPKRIKLFVKVAYGMPIDLKHTATVNEEFVPRGWVFNFVENGECTLVVGNELMQILKSIRGPEMELKFAFAFYVRSAVNICLSLYGVISREKMKEMYQVLMEGTEGEHAKLQGWDITEALDAMEKQGFFWCDDDYIISPYLQTEEEYKGLLKEQKGKDYYLPDDDVIAGYACGGFLQKSPEYEAVHSRLTRELKDSDLAEEMLGDLAGYVVRDGWGIPRIMDCLYEWDVIFDGSRSANRLTAALSEWLYVIRRWSECGHSRKELHKVNEELQYVVADDRPKKKAAERKVYPNDPCPCGSGRKYKKCCGR